MKVTIATIAKSTFGILVAYFLNYSIIERFVLGDRANFATDEVETGRVFNLFYEISSNTGYHPEPSNFNFILTALLGLILGLFSPIGSYGGQYSIDIN